MPPPHPHRRVSPRDHGSLPVSARPASASPTSPLLLSAALAGLTVLVFAPICTFDFVPWDDPLYVTQNPMVLAGLTAQSVMWALTTGDAFYWHPLTWLTHMLDVELFGLNAGGHHALNLLLHAASTLVLFHAFRVMTGKAGRSAFVAGLFAVHPLHVESVAWVAERKDVLSGFFYILALAGYAFYARMPGRRRYGVVLVLFVLGLMSKPMVVTLPFALLLLDVWPLRRISFDDMQQGNVPGGPSRRSVAFRLVVEKLPLVALSIGLSVVTFLNQSRAGSVRDLGGFPLDVRVANAVLSYVSYLRDMVWPTRLAAYYPYPTWLPGWPLMLPALAGLAAVSVLAIVFGRRRPYLPVGWFWYVGTLLPVIGLVQVGDQARADRFTYLPLIGLFLLVAWGVPDLLGRWRRASGTLLAVAGVSVVLSCAVGAGLQVRYWKDGYALWTRAEEVTTPNQRTYASLGQLLEAQGRAEEAVGKYRQAVPFMRDASGLHARIGALLMQQGRATDAIPEFAAAVRSQPNSAVAHAALAGALEAAGRPLEALEQLEAAVRDQPDSAVGRRALGLALKRQGRISESLRELAEAVRLRPDWALARTSLALALRDEQRIGEAVREASEAVRLEPANPEWQINLSVLLSQRGDLSGAVQRLEEALRLAPQHAEAAVWHYNLAALLNQMDPENRAPVVAHLEAALKLSPQFEDARRALAEIGRR